MKEPQRRQRGYTLIEILVAFAVLAMALTLLLGALARASRQVSDSSDSVRATLYAQSILEEAGLRAREGRFEGALEDGRFTWTLEVRPWAGEPGLTNESGLKMLELDLQIRWGHRRGQQLEVRSLRLAAPDGSEAVAP